MDTLTVCLQCEKVNRVPVASGQSRIPVCGSCKAELPIHSGVQELSGSALQKLTAKASAPIVVDFWADWCGPCKIFAPVFQKVAQQFQGRALFVKLNTEKYPFAAQTHQIRGIPTLIIFKDGLEVDRQSGALPEGAFLQYLKRWIGSQ